MVLAPGGPITGSSGPRCTCTAVEGTLEDLEDHHLTQGPPNGHQTVCLPRASHVDSSYGLQILPATSTCKGSRGVG